MLIGVVASLLISGQTRPAFPVGSYRPDVTKAPIRSQGILQAYYGQSLLLVRSDGTFVLCGIAQEGFWRKHKDRFVFVYDGFMHIRASEPDDEIRKRWPTNNLEGFIASPGPGGTLSIADMGRVPGPIIFRPMAKRSLEELIAKSNPGDEESAATEEAHYSLHDRLQTDWRAALKYIGDAKNPIELRSWTAIVFRNVNDPAASASAARLLLSMTPSAPKRERSIWRNLASAAVQNPTDATADILLQAVEKGLVTPNVVAPALGKLGRRSDAPILISWLNSDKEYDRIESLEALTLIGATEAFAEARILMSDPEESVRVSAWGFAAKLSTNQEERQTAIQKLAAWLKSEDFLIPFAAMEALSRSGAPEALPHLVAVLGSNMDPILRRNTARALGDLGDLRAVSALIEAQNRQSSDQDSWSLESEVIRAAAEALVKLGKKKRAMAQSTDSLNGPH